MKIFPGILAATALLFSVSAATASETVPYSESAFSALSQTDQPVVLDVHADWCSTCRKQQEVLKQLLSTDKYKGYTLVVIDFDKQTDVLKQFKVAQRSTLIVMRGKTERGRATAITSSGDIAALLDQAAH